MPTPEQIKIATEITKAAADEGRIIEAGFDVLKALAISPDAPQVQIDEMRLAYMAGAHHLWSSIMSMLDPGTEETPADLDRMTKIQNELEAWEGTLKLRMQEAEGKA